MEGFNFNLQKVLDFKLSVEEKKKEEFVKAQKNCYAQELYVNEIMEQKQTEINTVRKLKNGFEYQNYVRYLDFLEQRIQTELEKLTSLAELLNQRKLELIKSTSDRKSIEKLKEKAKGEFDLELARKDQKLNDDYAMLSYLKQERR
jgi:flagellar protein FliJ